MYLLLCALLMILILVLLLQKRHATKAHWTRENDLQHRQLMEEMSQRIAKELFSFQQLLHQGMQSDLHMLQEDTTQRLFAMEKSMNQSIQIQLEHTGKVFSTMMQEMATMQEAQKRLHELSADIQGLQFILNDKKTRGIYGEIELYSLLEQAMGDHVQRWQKQVKLSNGAIADAIIYGSETMPQIAIDSKFPLENYRRMMDPSFYKDEQKRLQNQFIADVKKHIQAIAQKYIIPQETADFAYLFLPAESLFSYIHANLPQLVEYGFQEHVYLVSPTTLMAYITAIKAIYLNAQRSANMAQIQTELKKLALEFERFTKRYTTVSNDYERTHENMRQLMITAEKLNKRFAAIANVELQEGDHERETMEETKR